MNTFKDYFNSVNVSQIHENDAKLGIDKLAELSDFLSKGNVKIFIVTSSRHVIETEEHNVTGKYIYDTFYADPEAYPDFLRFNDPMPSFNELMVKIFQGKVAVIDHEENTAYFGLNMDQIKQYAMEDHDGYREYIKNEPTD